MNTDKRHINATSDAGSDEKAGSGVGSETCEITGFRDIDGKYRIREIVNTGNRSATLILDRIDDNKKEANETAAAFRNVGRVILETPSGSWLKGIPTIERQPDGSFVVEHHYQRGDWPMLYERAQQCPPKP